MVCLTLVPRKHFVKKVNNSYWNFVREVEEVNEDGAARVEEEYACKQTP